MAMDSGLFCIKLSSSTPQKGSLDRYFEVISDSLLKWSIAMFHIPIFKILGILIYRVHQKQGLLECVW